MIKYHLTKNPIPDRCTQEVIYYTGSWPHWKQCSRKWVVEEDGIKWCKQHSPTKVKERRVASQAHYEASMAPLRRQWQLAKACDGVPTENLPPGIVKKLISYVYEMDNEALIKEIEGNVRSKDNS